MFRDDNFDVVVSGFELKFRAEKNNSAKSHSNNLNLKKIQSRKALNIGNHVHVKFFLVAGSSPRDFFVESIGRSGFSG